MKRSGGTIFARMTTLGTVVLALLASGTVTFQQTGQSAYAAKNQCELHAPQGSVKHVISIEFDNTHFTRDNPNVPSDLEQMPNLLNFIKDNGSLLANNHTPLISHTATDILTTLTGVYPNNHGVPVSNSYRYFNPDGTTNGAGSFAYWTAPINDSSTPTPTDKTYTMLAANGKNAPAPWVPFTRAGCNFGAVATANTILENTGVDVPTVFGANSPEAAEAKANSALASTDFVGIGVHCASGNALCATSNGQNDLLPDEPGGYTGYKGLFGHKYVAPQISSGPLQDLDGKVIQDSKGNPGFPGFDGMSPAVSLGYVAAMQEHNVPVTYAYISDAHDNHAVGKAFGPGEAGYVAALKTYDEAFGKFFARLQKDGINKNNTLFVFTADEGDHFAGGAPSPADCDGVTIPCTYSKIGEVNTNMTGLLATQQQVTTPFTLHADSAPVVYLTGKPAPDAAVTRTFERAAAALTTTNPITGDTEKISNYLADPVELNFLHMTTADPARTPTFTMFAKPDYYLFASKPDCSAPCVVENPAYAWNHGDVSPDINTTWLGLVGPGVKHLGVNTSIWSDHTDTRPTLLELLGLKDDYRHDGRVLFEALNDKALPKEVRENLSFYISMGQIYKQINAPLGELGLTTLKISTIALESNDTDDSTYTNLENLLHSITIQRDTVARQLINLLENAAFGGHSDKKAAQGALIQTWSVLNHARTAAKQ